MLYTFRKQMHRWKLILWPVLISLATSSLVMLRRSTQVSSVITVNGDAVTLRDFTSRVREIQERVNQVRAQARSGGIPAELFLQMYGLSDPIQAAMEAVVYEKVIEGALSPLWIRLHEDVVSSEILKDLPANFLTADGGVDNAAYRRMLEYNHMRVSEYEDRKEEEIYRTLFDTFAQDAAYAGRGVRRAAIEQKLARKSFVVASILAEDVRRFVNKEEVSQAEQESYYETNKEKYRVAEKRSFTYWVVSPSVAEKKVEVSDAVVQSFYEKNKTSLYRIPARVKVRHILIKSSSEGEGSARKKADEVRAKAAAEPSSFASLAQEYSEDKDTARSGGVRDFFSRGTYDKAFEQAAFRLKNALDLSPVVKTDEGFEIIQLVERVSSSEKAFEDVRDEVEKAVRAKHALDWIRSHLERIKKDGGADQVLVKEITSAAESHKDLKDVEESAGNTHSLEGQIIKNGFTIAAIDGYSFFTQNDTYVLVQLKKKDASYIQPFKDVSKKVDDDIRAERVRRRVNELATEIQAKACAGVSLKEASKAYDDVEVATTGLLAAGDTKEGVFKKGGKRMLEKAFALRGEGQVLRHPVGGDEYLVMLAEVDAEREKEVELALASGDDTMSSADDEAAALVRAFTAALVRNAQVDFDEKLLKAGPHEESIPYDI